MCFKVDWASLIVGSKFTIFALFYFVFEGNFLSTSPQGAYIKRGDLQEGFLHYRTGGLISLIKLKLQFVTPSPLPHIRFLYKWGGEFIQVWFLLSAGNWLKILATLRFESFTLREKG